MTDPTREDYQDIGGVNATDLDLAGAVHDIRQMLAVISGRAGVLLARVPNDRCRENLRAIELAALDAGFILDRMDRAARGETGAEAETAPLRRSADDAALLIVPPQDSEWNTAGGPWRLENGIDEDLAAALPAQIVREVLGNLLLNAVEASPDGVAIRLSAERRAERVVIVLADDGPGIPEDFRDSIFAVGVSTSGGTGRGVGLAGCRRLLARWGANLRLATADSPGTAFELDLPAAAAVVPVEERRAAASVSGCRVLVVDDELAVREMLTEVLGELGCAVTAARDADEAGAIFGPDAFDLVVLDQSLPGVRGDELAGRLRDLDAAVAVALVTGWGGDEKLAAANPAHVDLTARKPLDVGRMQELIAEGAALSARRRSDS